MPLLLAVLALLMLAAPAAGAEQIDAAVQALRSDPVYVAPGAEDRLDATGAERVRTAIRERGEGPVYVAVLAASAVDEAGGNAAALLRELARTLDRPGAYA